MVSTTFNYSFAQNTDSAEDAGDRKKGPPGDRKPPTEEELAVATRMGVTSTLMGTAAIPESVDECSTDEGYTRLLCLTNILK